MLKLNVKPFQETLYGGYCGPASMKIVLAYYGIEASEKELAQIMGHSAELGTTDRDFVRAAKKFGLKAVIKNKSNFADLERWLKRGVPPIVDWYTRGRADYPDSEIADGHSSVVVGLDEKFIYLQDPEIGKIRKLKREDFLKVWFDYKGRLITPKGLVIRQLIAIYK